MLISELDEYQLGHLVWRLDHNTSCGLIAAGCIARQMHGDMDLVNMFIKYGNRSQHSAKILARKVINFKLSDYEKERLKAMQEFNDGYKKRLLNIIP